MADKQVTNGNPKLFHLPLEAYKARYTEMLNVWETEAFSQKFNVESVVPPVAVHTDIIKGEVLDTVQRPTFALSQVIDLMRRPYMGEPVWVSDFYHPGLDALAYSRRDYKLYSYLWAQTFDIYDFTHTLFFDWMRSWEEMAFDIYGKVFVASSELADRICAVDKKWTDKVEVVGLPFDSKHVRSLCPGPEPAEKDIDVVWSSRFDLEKNPKVFLELVRMFPKMSFAICTGRSSLVGNGVLVAEAQRLASTPSSNLTIYTNLSRAQYYSILRRSKVQFNAAQQDWVSFTLLEALTFRCLPVYPMFRSFPEAFLGNTAHLYSLHSVGAAAELVEHFVTNGAYPTFDDFASEVLSIHDGSLSRIVTEIAK